MALRSGDDPALPWRGTLVDSLPGLDRDFVPPQPAVRSSASLEENPAGMYASPNGSQLQLNATGNRGTAAMPHRVLVVDADPKALSATEGMLSGAGYLVTATTSFVTAMQRLMLAPPDLLMAEVRLGPYNGLHLVHRARVRHPEMMAIITDRKPDPVLQEEAANAKAAYLPKPLESPALLIETVRGMLAGRPVEPGIEAMRQWARKSQTAARLNDIPVTLADLSYGGLIEIPRRGALLQHSTVSDGGSVGPSPSGVG